MSDEFRLVWMENALGIDQILAIIQDCSKDCTTCNRDEKDTCRLEMREALNSLCLIVKDLALSLLQLVGMANKKPVDSDVI